MQEPDTYSFASLGRRAYITVIFCCLVAMLDGADAQAMAIVAPMMMSDLAIRADAFGMVFSVTMFGAAVGALAAGVLADRFGPKRILVFCTLLFGVLQFVTAYVDRIETLLLYRAIAGLGLGGATPCFLALAAASMPPALRVRTLGVIWAFYPVGAFVGGLANGWLVEYRSWQDVFFYGGMVPVVVALLLSAIVREEKVVERPEPGSAGLEKKLYAVFVHDKILRFRVFLLCCVFFGVFATLAGIVIWMPTLLVANGFTLAQGGMALSWHALGALVSIAAGGFLLERFGPRLLTVGLFVSTVLLLVLGNSLTVFWPAIIAMMLLGVFLGGSMSGGIALGDVLFPQNIRSSGMGLAMAVGRLGQMVLPYLMGLSIAHGFTGAWTLQVTAVLPLMAAGAAYLLNRSLKHQVIGQ